MGHLQQNFTDDTKTDKQERTSDNWFEFGPTLLLVLLPLLACLFRRGWLLSLFFINIITFNLFAPQTAHANTWDNLWKNNDQKGLSQWQAKKYDEAAKQFQNPQWQGSAEYKRGNYEAALQDFEKDKSAIGNYNRGNALAQLQRYDDAIAAYEEALSKQPDLSQAKRNKEKVEALKKQKEQEQQKNKDQQSKNDNSENSSSKNEKSEDDASTENKNSQSKSTQSGSKEDKQSNSKKSEEEQKQQSSQEQKSSNNNQQQKTQDNRGSQADQQDQQQPDDKEKDPTKSGIAKETNLSPEEQQALQQWLRKVPDDPSGLLKRKFEYEFQKRRQEYQQGQWQLPENNAHKRY